VMGNAQPGSTCLTKHWLLSLNRALSNQQLATDTGSDSACVHLVDHTALHACRPGRLLRGPLGPPPLLAQALLVRVYTGIRLYMQA
jgi:hypothetical protein